MIFALRFGDPSASKGTTKSPTQLSTWVTCGIRRIASWKAVQAEPVELRAVGAHRLLGDQGQVHRLVAATAVLAAGQRQERFEQPGPLLADRQQALEVRPVLLHGGALADQRLLE
jgi:hypothetical protein